MRKVINCKQAPQPIGAYSQAVRVQSTVYVSGQIGLDANTMELVSQDFVAQVTKSFQNLQAVVQACGGELVHVVKMTLYLLDMQNFSLANEVMTRFFSDPYPARAAVAVAALPKGAQFEVDAVVVLPE